MTKETIAERNQRLFRQEIAARTDPIPKQLYKYTSLETAIRILRGRRVRFQSPATFNDPFDGQWNVLWETETPEALDAFVRKCVSSDVDSSRFVDPKMREEVEKMRRAYQSLPSQVERDKYIEDWKHRFSPGDIATPRLVAPLNHLRLFCLSEVDNSLQMWSHYADHHKGAVLSFDPSVLEPEWSICARRVNYCEEFPNIIDTPKFLEDTLFYGAELPEVDGLTLGRTWSLAKASGWSYEREWRFSAMSAQTDRTFEEFDLPEPAVLSVVAGCRCLEVDRVRLEYEVRARNARASFGAMHRFARGFQLVRS